VPGSNSARASGAVSTHFRRDDGAGFDPRYADRLFGAFQRLHTEAQLPGSGARLATVQRIIDRHAERFGRKERSKKARRSILLCDEKTGEKKGLWTTIVLLVEDNPDDEARILRESLL
jgi:hypothetical protein